MVITNVPFADVRIVDKAYDNKPYRIHDYFFKKAIDLVPYHGMVAAITSTGTADKSASSILPELRRSGTQFLGGVRLPNTAFKDAGTRVVTDILFPILISTSGLQIEINSPLINVSHSIPISSRMLFVKILVF